MNRKIMIGLIALCFIAVIVFLASRSVFYFSTKMTVLASEKDSRQVTVVSDNIHVPGKAYTDITFQIKKLLSSYYELKIKLIELHSRNTIESWYFDSSRHFEEGSYYYITDAPQIPEGTYYLEVKVYNMDVEVAFQASSRPLR